MKAHNKDCDDKRNLIENLLSESYLVVNSALQLDLNDQKREALIAYEEAVRLFAEIECILNENKHYSSAIQEIADKHESNIKKLKEQSRDRIDLLIESLSHVVDSEPPPYDHMFPKSSLNDAEIPSEIVDIASAPNLQSSFDVILHLEDGVRVFFIGNTTEPRLAGTFLLIQKDRETSEVILSSEEWSFHFKSGALSPVLKTDYGAYIFVNENSGRENFVGVVFNCISDEDLQIFEDVIRQHGELIDESDKKSHLGTAGAQTSEFDDILDSNSALIRGSKYIANTIASGSSFLTEKLQNLFDTIHPSPHLNTEEREVNAAVLRASGFMRSTFEYAKKISKFTADKISDLIYSAIGFTSPYANKALVTVLRSVKVSENRSNELVENAQSTLRNGVTGFAVIVGSLQNAGDHLSEFLIQHAVYDVDQRYGKKAAILTDNTLRSAADAGRAIYYGRCLDPRTVPRRVLKNMAYMAVKQDKSRPKSNDA